MSARAIIAIETVISLFAGKRSHFPIPLDHRTAGARSEGQGRRFGGAVRRPLTAASTSARWRRSGEGAPVRYACILLAGLLASVTGPSLANAQSVPDRRAAPVDPYVAPITAASQRFGVPAAWIRAVLRAESAGDPRAVSPKGAMGLMQIMPDTWAGLRARHGLGSDPYDPGDNILAGAAYLRELHDRYGSVAAMLAAYNAGPGRYEASLAGRPLPVETRAYVATILPVIDGGATVTPAMMAAVGRLAWTRSPLFIARVDGASAVDGGQQRRMPRAIPMPAERPLGDASTVVAPAADVRDVSAIVPQSDGLFVARADSGRQP